MRIKLTVAVRGAGRQRWASPPAGRDSGGGGLEGSSSDAEVETAEGGDVSGELTISQWPLYIDKKTIPGFEEETGVNVDYIEDINDNTEFFAKMRPQLAQGESGGRDIIVATDWMAKKMYDLGYLQDLDKSALPNVEENLLPSLQRSATSTRAASSRFRGRAG